jgi:hypothetical protein
MDISLAKEMIHYDPLTEIEWGLKETWDWYKSHPDEHKVKFNYFDQ